MPRAEAGTTKAIANQMKAKGLQRLRWYCQACQRQMRDENGFKCHVASESHVRNMMVIGEDPRKAINEFSQQFQRDFVQLLRTAHGEKAVNANHFYQEYIHNKEHIHMNATRWASLTEFCKHLGREGIVRVEIDEKNAERGGASGLMVAWIDNSPEKLRRQETLKKKERQDRSDELREQRQIEEQIKKARQAAANNSDDGSDRDEENETQSTHQGIKRIDGGKIKLSFGAKKTDTEKPPSPPLTDKSEGSDHDAVEQKPESTLGKSDATAQAETNTEKSTTSKIQMKPLTIASSKPKNIFAAAAKKNPLGGTKKAFVPMQQKPMSEVERIMKEEIERKRQRENPSGNAYKKQRIG